MFRTTWGLVISFAIGVIVLSPFIPSTIESPSLLAVLGYVFLGMLAGVLFFGKLTPVFLAFIGGLMSGWIISFPFFGILWSIPVIGAAMYGRALGALILDDFFEQGKTRLNGYVIAALLNVLLLVIFSILVWFLFPLLPNQHVIQEWVSLQGFPV